MKYFYIIIVFAFILFAWFLKKEPQSQSQFSQVRNDTTKTLHKKDSYQKAAEGSSVRLATNEHSPRIGIASDTEKRAYITIATDVLELDESSDEYSLAEQIELSQIVLDVWNHEKAEFYREELGLSDTQIEYIKEVDAFAGAELSKFVAEQEKRNVSAEEFYGTIDKIQNGLKQKILKLLGKARFDQAVEFREAFNRDEYARFGIGIHMTGF